MIIKTLTRYITVTEPRNLIAMRQNVTILPYESLQIHRGTNKHVIIDLINSTKSEEKERLQGFLPGVISRRYNPYLWLE